MHCTQCGKEISEMSKYCGECGCPVPNQKQSKTEKEENEEIVAKSRKARTSKIFIVAGIVLLLLFTAFVVLGKSVSSEVEETKDNITPYLDYIGKYAPDGEYIEIDEALKEKRRNVSFMGMDGHISFDIEDNYIYECSWESNDEFSEEEYQSKIDDLYLYFGEEPTYWIDSYHTGDTYFYYWTDPNNGFSVTCFRHFVMYDSAGYLKIKWEAKNDVLEKIKEVPNNTQKADEIEKRAEARDYDEFKHAVDVCIELIPDCKLYLNSTDDENSYSVLCNDRIIGILGTKIDSWDAVALTDPDKEEALLHHEQISIALIMACDSTKTYEDAKIIFEDAKENGSAYIKSGIYFFEGVAEGMYAGGVDITWLD